MSTTHHYEQARMALGMADEQAAGALANYLQTDEPLDAGPGMAGAIVTLLAAQVHATLAVADAIKESNHG